MSSTKPYFEKTLSGLLGNTAVSQSGCMEWLGAKNTAGYGHVLWGDKYKMVTRLVLELSGRPPSKDQYACHSCDNPKCINPEHLFCATNSENLKDAQNKKRMRIAKHGTRSKYVSGCKCKECLSAEAEYARSRRMSK